MIYVGVIENRDDPLKLGRCQVRVVGLHTDDKNALPTKDLPWAFPMQPVTSAAINGIGWSPTGPVPGTWVVIMFQDKDNQMPIMLGSLGGIPQSKAAQKIALDGAQISTGNENKSDDLTSDLVSKMSSVIGSLFGAKSTASETIGADKDGTPTITPPKVEPTPQAIAPDAQATTGNPAAATESTLKSAIPTKPPAKYASNATKQEQCIKAIISACDKLGLTSKYAKASILGICGGESAWLPVEEGYSYSADALLKVFPGVFGSQPAKAQEYARWKGSTADFFRFVYSPNYRNGKAAGNKLPDDGALFYGRGFNQITGRALYEQLENELKKAGINAPISKQPDLLINNIDISAAATVMFYKINVKANQNSPDYFNAALKRTGNAVGQSYEKKKVLYQYFLGEGVLPASTNKPSAAETKTYSKEEVKYLPANKQAALTEDRSGADAQGFQDPNGKYPLRNLLDEPDTNRLARGIIKETAVEFKDATRTTGVQTANGADGSWEQPLAPFGGIYPYSKVYESESGHLMVFDDSPGHENISLYHRTGSFVDIDANGTMVHKIVGDGYVIMDRNGFVTIEGKCNVHIGGSATVLVEGSADIEVKGSTNAVFHNQVDIGCATDVNWAIGGDLNLKIDGNFNTTIGKNHALSVAGTSSTQVTGAMTTLGEATIKTQAKGNLYLDSAAALYTQSAENTEMKSGAALLTQMEGEFSVKANSPITLQTSAAAHLKAAGAVNIDGSQLKTQNGSAASASDVESFEAFEKFAPLAIAAPAVLAGSTASFEVLQTPVRPSPQIIIKTEVSDTYNSQVTDFQKNPNKYYSADAEAAGVNPQRPPQPDLGDAGQSLRSGAEPSDITSFLSKQLVLAKEGYWTESGMKDKNKSNPNIMAMWKDIGMESIAKGLGDQTAWCMAFVNWTLKQCNYRYVQSARAYDLRDKPARWNATKVSDPQPGDICVWSYSHVNFVYEVKNGKCTFVGGNQGGGKVSDNNPTGGSVTISYPNGVPINHKNIVGFYRPSKT